MWALRATSPCHVTNPVVETDVLLGEFTTHFKSTDVRRSANVRRAALRLHGVVMSPRESLSYNAVVGPRTAQTGYHPALVIDQGKYVERPGGGVCQPSSTLHAAALFAGMSVLERSQHSWQSPYIGPGLDATVVWYNKDLVIRNPYPFDVRVHVDLFDDHITFRLLGGKAPKGWVEVVTQVVRTFPFNTFEKLAPKLRAGRRLLTARGIDGLRVKRVRQWRNSLGVVRSERLSTDAYYPRHERYLVGPQLATSLQSSVP